MLPLVSLSSPRWWLPALPLLYWLAGTSATGYKSVTKKGVVTFFDTPPVNEIALETLVGEAPGRNAAWAVLILPTGPLPIFPQVRSTPFPEVQWRDFSRSEQFQRTCANRQTNSE
jgi:hypothetical protein